MDWNLQLNFSQEIDIEKSLEKAVQARNLMLAGKGPGSEFLGWLELPGQMQTGGLVEKMVNLAGQIRAHSPIFVTIGIGGSYLGAKAALAALVDPVEELAILKGQKQGSVIRFAGHHLDSSDFHDLLSLLDMYDFSVNVISKSGTTTEPAIAFRIIRDLMKVRYGKGYAKRVFATTDAAKGALRTLSDQEGFETFAIPDSIGGRYSVLTPVGLLPLAVAGVDIAAMVQGAVAAQKFLHTVSNRENPAILYAALRNQLYESGHKMELLVSYLAKTSFLAEWWKQLFGESEGKQGKGLWPASVQFTTDLHSLGQWIQDGPRHLFETILNWEEGKALIIPVDDQDLDGLNYLAGEKISFINEKAKEGTRMAHLEGGVPIIDLYPGPLDAFHFGALFYFFEYSCGISAYMLAVNPFDQPGVEAYKKNMFRLLGKP